MNNTIDLQSTDLFEELDNAELVAVCGGASATVSADIAIPTVEEFSSRSASANSSNRGLVQTDNGILVVSANTNVAV